MRLQRGLSTGTTTPLTLTLAGLLVLGSAACGGPNGTTKDPAEGSEGSAGSATPSSTTTPPDVDAPDSPTVVVNKARPLDPVDYAPENLEPVAGSHVQLRADAAEALAGLREAAAADGHEITVLSGYRSYDRQQEVYAHWVNVHGQAEADRVSARPGHSEHQTGLAVDIGDAAAPDCDLHACFGDTGSGRWVAEHAAEHGFIVRYPDGAEHVTGFSPEPWHLRWVGPDQAREVSAAGGVLETALELPAAPDYTAPGER